MLLKIRHPTHFSPQQEDEDGGFGGGGSSKTEKRFPRAGVGEKPVSDGKVVKEATTQWIPSHNPTPGNQNCPGEVGQDEGGRGRWGEAHPQAKRVEGEGEEAGQREEEGEVAPSPRGYPRATAN